MGIDTTAEQVADDGRSDEATDFSIVVSMRGRAAHLAVKGTLDGDARQTLEHLVERLPDADVTELVIDLVGDDPASAAAAAAGQEVVEAVVDASTVPVSVLPAR